PRKRSVCTTGLAARSSSQIGKGFSVQRGSVWSKSLTQSLTGGCSGRWLGGESDIGRTLYLVLVMQLSMGTEDAYSSVTSIAISGQFDLARYALSSRPDGTVPSPISCALPNSSRLKSSGASDLQRAWPWHLSWSTWIFSFP